MKYLYLTTQTCCMRGMLVLVLLLFFNFSIAQVVRTPVSTTYTRLATYSRMQQDVFSFAANQGALASVKNISVGAYGEKRFLMQELSSYAASAALPTDLGNFGLMGNYFGSAAYNESVLSLAYARKLGEKMDIGVQFNYNNFRVSGYGSAAAVNFDAGFIFHLTEQLHTGVHVYNPTGVKLGKQSEEKLPAIYSAGLGYDVSDKFFVGAEVEKVEDRPLNVHAGMQYLFNQKILARAGISSAASIFYIGTGFFLQNIRIDATATVHPQLGVTPGVMIIYSAGK